MKQTAVKTVICPNCFGNSLREVLATATSRNIVHDDTAPPLSRSYTPDQVKREKVVKLMCNHCGHELTRKGGRA